MLGTRKYDLGSFNMDMFHRLHPHYEYVDIAVRMERVTKLVGLRSLKI
jgi:hypothetical protein